MKRFKEYSPDQQLLLPPNLDDWLEEGHLAYFIRDVVGELDPSQLYDDYHSQRGGQPAYEPQMMVSLLLYGYCVGVASSRKIDQANDMRQVEPLTDQLQQNTGGSPQQLSADTGYFSEDNVNHLAQAGIDGYVATRRTKHTEEPGPAPRGPIPKDTTVKQRMERKLRTKKGRAAYAKRKHTVEPIFGQIKQARGFRRFLLRGLEPVRAEWRLICLGHNLLKLFCSGAVVAAT